MSLWTCAQARRALAAYHDHELDLASQVAMQAHLRSCPSCLAERRHLSELGAMLRMNTPAHRGEEQSRLERAVLARLQAERPLSLRGHVNRLREELHLVWAVTGATLATVVIVCAAVGMMRVALQEQPLSMAALIGTMSTPGSNRNPVTVDDRMLLPRRDPGALVEPPGFGHDELEFALAAVVTREGRVRNLELLADARRVPMADQAMLELLDVISQARFEPARAGGAPVAVSLVWLVAHTTVRGKPSLDWPALQAPRAIPRPGLPVSERPSRLETTAA
jgi:hypothetical protein